MGGSGLPLESPALPVTSLITGPLIVLLIATAAALWFGSACAPWLARSSATERLARLGPGVGPRGRRGAAPCVGTRSSDADRKGMTLALIATCARTSPAPDRSTDADPKAAA